MKFIITTQELNFLISKCLNVVGAKPTVPIVGNVLIEAANGLLVVTATDLSVGIRCVTEAKVLEEGSTTLSAKHFGQLVRELTSVNIEVTTSPNEITEIVSDASRFKLPGVPSKEYPSLPDMREAKRVKFQQKDLKEALYRTAFAVARDDTRFVFTGVYMQLADGQATFTGTDGKRLSKSRMPMNLDTPFNGNFILPLKAVEEVLKNLSEDGEGTLLLMPDKVGIEVNNVTLITKLLTGEYPDVNRIIPENVTTTVALHREELIALLRQIVLFTTDNHYSVRFSFLNGELKLSSNTAELGEGRVSMPVNYYGQKLDIAFNPAFFLDILRHSKEEVVTMGITDPYNPGIITDSADPNLSPASARSLFILMPMRLE